MLEEVGEKRLLGFIVLTLAQLVFGLIISAVASSTPESPLFILIVFYVGLAMIGGVFMLFYKFGHWIAIYRNFVYAIIGLLTPVIGLACVVWLTLKFAVYFLSFRWVGNLFRYLGSSD